MITLKSSCQQIAIKLMSNAYTVCTECTYTASESCKQISIQLWLSCHSLYVIRACCSTHVMLRTTSSCIAFALMKPSVDCIKCPPFWAQKDCRLQLMEPTCCFCDCKQSADVSLHALEWSSDYCLRAWLKCDIWNGLKSGGAQTTLSPPCKKVRGPGPPLPPVPTPMTTSVRCATVIRIWERRLELCLKEKFSTCR